MTLIAGFRTFGVPILIGDFLLTRRGQPAGLSKKVRKLRKNCVLGWTGQQLAAERVMRHLDQRLTVQHTTRQELELCLRSYDVLELGSLAVRLVGWVVDDEEHCFRWNSGYPHEVFYGEPMFDGSGDTTIETLTGLRFINDPLEPNLVSTKRAVDASLDIATSLVSDEVFNGINRRRGFGHAYEILYLQGQEFEYVSDVLYVLLAFAASDEGVLSGPKIRRPIYKYRALEELSVVDTLGENNERLIHLITAVGDSQSKSRAAAYARQLEQTPKKELHFGFESQYYCIFVHVESGPLVGHLLTTVQGPEWPPEQCFIKAEKNEFHVGMPVETLDELYRTLRKYR